jgi:hypothetical protein
VIARFDGKENFAVGNQLNAVLEFLFVVFAKLTGRVIFSDFEHFIIKKFFVNLRNHKLSGVSEML